MSIRYKSGLQAATDTYEKDGRTVTLVGVSHVADKSFWATVQQLISAKEADGAAIHYERVLNDVEGPHLPTLDMKTIAPAIGMQFQWSGINYKEDSWIRTDMTWSEAVAHATRNEPTPPHPEQIKQVLNFIGGTPRRRRITRQIASLLITLLVKLPFSGPQGIPRSIILDHRNEIAAKAALEATGDVVAVWGAAHLPGIGRILTGHGFTHTAREWHTAMKRDPA